MSSSELGLLLSLVCKENNNPGRAVVSYREASLRCKPVTLEYYLQCAVWEVSSTCMCLLGDTKLLSDWWGYFLALYGK